MLCYKKIWLPSNIRHFPLHIWSKLDFKNLAVTYALWIVVTCCQQSSSTVELN